MNATDKPNPITLETSPYRDHFDFVADCVLLKRESRSEFFNLLAGLIDEYQPATFTESTITASLAVYRWRQIRICGMFAAVTASEHPDRTALLARLVRQESLCERLFDNHHKQLLKAISARATLGGPRRASKRSATRKRDNLRVFPKATPPLAA